MGILAQEEGFLLVRVEDDDIPPELLDRQRSGGQFVSVRKDSQAGIDDGLVLKINAEGRTRTGTLLTKRGILSPSWHDLCLVSLLLSIIIF